MNFNIEIALHQTRLLSARLKRTRSDYEKTSLHKFDKTVVQSSTLFSLISSSIQRLEQFEAKLIDMSVEDTI